MNDKLGRLRKDTLRSLTADKVERLKKSEEEQRRAKRAGFKKVGNKILMLSKFDGTCAICKNDYRIGAWVYYDHTKESGNTTAHQDCYDLLLKSKTERFSTAP